MGFRFRRRVKLFPGFWLNFSKSGVSTSTTQGYVAANPADSSSLGLG